MANAIKKISVQRGYDVTEYALATFGGAGGQHACAVADALGMTSILIHPHAGVLSAYGMGLADVTAMREAAVEVPLSGGAGPDLRAALDRLDAAARAELTGQGVPAGRIRAARRVHLRYDGTDTALVVPAGTPEEMAEAFEAAYLRRFSFLMRDKPVTVEAVSVELTGASEPVTEDRPPGRRAAAGPTGPAGPTAECRARVFTGGGWAEVGLYRRPDLCPGRLRRRARDHCRGQRHDGGRARLAGCRERRWLPGAEPYRGGASAPGRQRRRRPGPAGDLQQPVHVHRRADGLPAAEHRPLGQRQGAPGLLLRDLRRATAASSSTRRTCRCTSGRWAKA